eukprot:3838342-Prymnesium_polylepis.1
MTPAVCGRRERHERRAESAAFAPRSYSIQVFAFTPTTLWHGDQLPFQCSVPPTPAGFLQRFTYTPTAQVEHIASNKNRLELKRDRPELQAVGLAGPPAARVDAGAL